MIAATLDSLLLMFLTPLFDWLVPIRTEKLLDYTGNNKDPVSFLFFMLTNKVFMTSWICNFALQMLVMCAFSAICWHFWAATPGKMLMRIKIVDIKTEAPISDRQIIIRLLGYFVSGIVFFLGFLWIGISSKRQAWHDSIAGTAVIVLPWRKKKPQALAETVIPPVNEAEQPL